MAIFPFAKVGYSQIFYRSLMLLLVLAYSLTSPLAAFAAEEEHDRVAEPSTDSFIIKEAEWEDDGARLEVEGRHNTPGTEVVIRNANTNALLGTSSVRPNGEWELKVLALDSVPCRIEAQAGASTLKNVNLFLREP